MLPTDFEPHFITVTEREDISVVSFVRKELSEEENLEILGQELFSLVDQFGCQKIILDMTGVLYLTSSVLGKIITLHRKLQRGAGSLVLCRIEPGVIDTLQTSRLMTYFTTAEDVSAAVQVLS